MGMDIQLVTSNFSINITSNTTQRSNNKLAMYRHTICQLEGSIQSICSGVKVKVNINKIRGIKTLCTMADSNVTLADTAITDTIEPSIKTMPSKKLTLNIWKCKKRCSELKSYSWTDCHKRTLKYALIEH